MKDLFSALAGVLLCLLSISSSAQTRIAAYEYWIDGNYAAKTAGTISPVVNATINFTANTAAIHPGYHTLSYWVKDNNGKWSPVITKGFTNSYNNMSKFEYWFDGKYSTAVQVSIPNTFNGHLYKSNQRIGFKCWDTYGSLSFQGHTGRLECAGNGYVQ